MPATIRASHKRLLVLLLVAALLSATTASAHVPKPTTRVFGDENVRLDNAWSALDLSEKPRLGDPREKSAFCPPSYLCKSLNALVDSVALRSNPDRNVFFFQGRERDPATGLYDFRNRWYDANLARFVSFDPKPYVDGPNAYGGFVGNPVTMSDPTGEFVPLLATIGMGLLNVGFSAAINHTFGDGDYSLMDAAQDFTIGALSGGLGTLTKGSKMLTVAAEVGVGALDSQVRSVRETGELMNFTDSVNQGAIGTLTGRVGARAIGGVAKPVFKAIGKVTGVATSRLGKVLSHVRPTGISAKAGVDDAAELVAQRRLTRMTGNTGNAHYLGRHSPLISDQALLDRATRGVDPWTGQVKLKKNGQPSLLDSTRFNSHQDMLGSIEKAQRSVAATFPNGGIPTNGTAVTVNMLRDIGVGFGKGTGVFKSGLTRAKVIFNRHGQVISAYPLYK